MAATVRVLKGLLTKRSQTIQDWLENSAQLISEPPESASAKQERISDVRLALKVCCDYIDLIESSMTKLANAFDAIDEHSDEEEKQLDRYMETAQDLIVKLHVHKSELECTMNNCERDDPRRSEAHGTAEVMTPLSVSKLPQIPIPIFSGKRWGWDNFWALFRANVHDQDLTNLQKFNYLLSALRGEARQSISRFRVTSNNYEKAVEHLQSRYGGKDGIIMDLNRGLNSCVARGPGTNDQRRLFDKLSAIAAQQKEHGEHLDNQLTIQIFLQKFHKRIQKAAMERRLNCDGEEPEWDLDRWLDTIDDIISKEEMLKEMLFPESETERGSFTKEKRKEGNTSSCECCKQQGHRWNFCPRIPNPSARRKFLLETSRCLNCGSSAHRVALCSSGNCRNCHEKHHTAICTKSTNTREEARQNHPQPLRQQRPSQPSVDSSTKKGIKRSKQHVVTSEPQQAEENSDSDATVLHMNKQRCEALPERNKVVLLAGQTKVLDFQNHPRDATVLLDTGSELSFIDEDFATELGLPVEGTTSLLISTFGSQTPSPKKCNITTAKVCDMEGCEHEIRLYRSDYITGAIDQAELDQGDLDFISKQGINLILPGKRSTVQPQILLGCDYLWNFIMPMGKLSLPSGLQLIPTKFGYIISGYQMKEPAASARSLVSRVLSPETEAWDRYWSLEATGTSEFNGSKQEELQMINNKVLDDFRNSIQRRQDGYYVRLPWKQHHPPLPDNKMIALKRLQAVMQMYAHNSDILRQYDAIFKEQLEKGIIEEVQKEMPPEGNVIHYLPHQAVLTPAKETTKMRIVFDASAHYKDRRSLNDVLHQGPQLLPSMVSILLRFRAHNIAIISDVEKAFLQVRLQEIDRDATRCLWVRNISLPLTIDNIITYRFTRVTFGLNTSPFLLAATIDFHLDQMTSSTDIASEIRDNLYVDNLILGAESSNEALDKYRLSKDVFEGLNMNLREFLSNDSVFNSTIRHEDRTKASCPKVLGIPGNFQRDTLLVRGAMAAQDAITKRTVSQQLAAVYDPLGFLVPLLLPAKIFLQSLWKEEYGWDELLPSHLQEKWRTISEGISSFHKEVERQAIQRNENCRMYVFADASQAAIASCVYIASQEASNLVLAKSKLPSLKTSITIPKLEMNALTLGARLAHFVYESLSPLHEISEIFFFTDSEIVLGWIKTPPDRPTVGVLVSNRLNEVRRIIKDLAQRGARCLFGHIPTSFNPADCGTRGLNSEVLLTHFWWNGPAFIRNDTRDSPEYSNLFAITIPMDEDTEEVQTVAHTTALLTKQAKEADQTTLFRLSRFNTLHKAIRVVAFVMRFLRRAMTRIPSSRIAEMHQRIPALMHTSSRPELTGAELREAKNCIIRDHQKTIVTEQCIRSQKNLNIQADKDGILRCFGRLGRADLAPSSITPIYVAPKTALAHLIIWEAHNHYHKVVAHTMATIRETYWIPKLRQQVTQLIRRCLPCQKFNNLPYRYPDMEWLPERRVRISRPFEHIGLDYFGPLVIDGTSEDFGKAYGCIFTCASTRLLHLELVEDLTTERFLNALRRFFARRGVPKSITSDNAPTFLLGEKILHDAIKRIAQREITWIHITPYAPWQGGFYERLIRSIKLAMYKALGKKKVSFDVLRTMFAEIEAVLNSRPLTYQEEGWEQQPLLRPIDFLQKDIILDFPLDYVGADDEDPTYHTSEEAQQLATQAQVENAIKSSFRLTEKFWQIWNTQYLAGLREHHKLQMDSKRGTSSKPQIGTARNTWNIGRIVEVVSHSSEAVREVVVELPNKNQIRRPVNRVIPLEIGAEDEEVRKLSSIGPHPQKSETVTTDLPGESKYNLRKRKKLQYCEDSEDQSDVTVGPVYRANPIRKLPLLLAILSFFTTGTMASNNSSGGYHIKCTDDGVKLTQDSSDPYEICAETYCVSFPSPSQTELVKFPPQITLHDYSVKWKTTHEANFDIIEITCRSTPFCRNIDCTICVANIANPECWPLSAVVGMGLAVYIILMMCYMFFAVPVILGHPLLHLLRILGVLVVLATRTAFDLCFRTIPRTISRAIGNFGRRQQQRRRRRIWLELAILMATFSRAALGCQEVNVFHQNLESCRISNETASCAVDTTEIIKINPFRREACLRLRNNASTVLEIRLLWKELQLICEKEIILYSRSMKYDLLDSKRCPHAGSCSGEKCAAVNRTSLVPELHKANQYPGITGCVESCGGLGCDCFYPSSGCLYYRIHLIPIDESVYEFFKCTRWKENVKLAVSLVDAKTPPRNFYIKALPNLPEQLPGLTITLSTITVPPTPLLGSTFLTDGTNTAVSLPHYSPPLQCKSAIDALNLTCEIAEDCTCTPAEVRMHCDCRNINLTSYLRTSRNRLPQLRPNVQLHANNNGVIAKIPQLPTAEFVLRIKGEFSTSSIISEALCTIEPHYVKGCYKCAKGAMALVTCKSSTEKEMAEIRCGTTAFTNSQGSQSKLRFFSEKARFYASCSVQCGKRHTVFEINGILHYTGSIEMAVRRLVNGESEAISEFNLPDFSHIFDVFLNWSGTLLLVVIAVGAAVAASYLIIVNSFFCFFMKTVLRLFYCLARFILRVLLALACSPLRLFDQRTKEKSVKTGEKQLQRMLSTWNFNALHDLLSLWND